ncbi:MAG: nitrogen fixation protein NifQ [Pseudomonadota bacterium]
MPKAIYAFLMACRNPAESAADARLFALTIAARAKEPREALSTTLGMAPEMLMDILARYFPYTLQSKSESACLKAHLNALAGEPFLCRCSSHQVEPIGEDREAELADLRCLLLDHRALGVEEETWFAHMVAAACLRPDHLWQDLGFESRADVSDLLARHFPTLHGKNGNNMKWKKFFYKQLCDRAEVSLCQAPSCAVCNDYHNCFGPEEAGGWALLGNGRAKAG